MVFSLRFNALDCSYYSAYGKFICKTHVLNALALHYDIFKCEGYTCLAGTIQCYSMTLLSILTTLIFQFFLHVGQVHMLVIYITMQCYITMQMQVKVLMFLVTVVLLQ